MTLRFRHAQTALPISEIPRLRELTSLSIGELRSRVADGVPLLEISAFENDWDHAREMLATLANEIATGSLCLSISELEDSDNDETPLTIEDLRGVLSHYREIELQDQRSEDLRMGVIHDPSEFEPHDDDWTQP